MDCDRSRRNRARPAWSVDGERRIGGFHCHDAKIGACVCFVGWAGNLRHFPRYSRLVGAGGGVALASALTISAPQPPRVRVMIGLALFGCIYLLAQRKGWFYHVYPLGIGVACWGAWSLASLPRAGLAGCLLVTAATLGWLVPAALTQETNYPALRAC